MSETYTTGGDTLHKVDNPDWQGQTFRPLETHTLEYIDLTMRGGMTINTPTVRVFYTDINHQPFGDCLSRDRYIIERLCSSLKTARVRFSMQPYLLHVGNYYCIIVSNFPPFPGDSAYWQYDKDDATYPRGIRISTTDSGITWIKHYNDDCMFAEFGTPPLPQPEPPPPIKNFAILDAAYLHLDNGIIFRVPTNVPCHLTCYYTDIEPLKHHRSATIRGLTVPWDTYFCFVAWKKAEQVEPGDTLYHTFPIPDWQKDQIRWFTVRGQVNQEDAPSIGPIFKHKHPGQDLIKNPGFETWTSPPGDAPDYWVYPPGPHHNVMWPDGIIKVQGYVSCRLDNPTTYGNYYIYQALPVNLLSGIKLTFKLQYRGKLSTWNWFRIRAIGDTNFWAYARPTQNYTWETLSITSTMPNNLTLLYLQAQNLNQGDPVPFQTWWDIARIELTIP